MCEVYLASVGWTTPARSCGQLVGPPEPQLLRPSATQARSLRRIGNTHALAAHALAAQALAGTPRKQTPTRLDADADRDHREHTNSAQTAQSIDHSAAVSRSDDEGSRTAVRQCSAVRPGKVSPRRTAMLTSRSRSRTYGWPGARHSR